MHLFYTPDITADFYTLSEEESKHCIRVLRLQPSDLVYLLDGRGGFYTAEIFTPHPKKTLLKILSHQEEYGKRNHYLHVAVAPTKNLDRLEWFLEKATEIGIDEITPVICERSERREVKTDRLNRIITSAVKQSIKAYHPRLNEPVRLKDFLPAEFPGQKFIAHCIDQEKEYLSERLEKYGSYLVLIGPEGDFTPNEVEQALSGGFLPVTLGTSRLRTETAALAACFEINLLNR